MAKDRIERDELANRLVERRAARGQIRAMAEMITGFVIEAEVSAKVGAEPYERAADRTTHHDGHRERRCDTRPGTSTLQAPEVRRWLRAELH